MSEALKPKTTEQILRPSPVAQEYSSVASSHLHILRRAEEVVDHAPEPDGVSLGSVINLLKETANDEKQRWQDKEQSTERFELLLEYAPRQIERLIEMAWEVRNIASVDSYDISTWSNGAQRKTRQILDSDKLTDSAKSYIEKYNLDQPQSRIFIDLLKLEPSELDYIWHDFEKVARKSGQLELKRQSATKRFEDETEAETEAKEQDELEEKRQERHGKAENDAISAANVLRYEAKKAILTLNPSAMDRPGFEDIKEPYLEMDERSEWSVEIIADFLERNPDRRTRDYREGWLKLQEELLSLIVGQSVYNSEVAPGKEPQKPSYFAGKIKDITGIAAPGESDDRPSSHELRSLGAELLSEYRHKISENETRRARQRELLRAPVEAINQTNAALDKLAAKIVDLAQKK